MRVSVVICTYNRLGSLRHTLNALGRQTFRAFEVIVVNGPSDDGTGEFLASRDDIRVVDNPDRHLSRSRNLGTAAAAGEAVAFIDDDAVPEARWLEELVAPFADPEVGATGGLVLDNTGVRLQWRYLVCARDGETDFDQEPPLDRFKGPGADPFLYLVGCNTAYRRAALERVGGFDDEIEIYYDETECCLQLHDAGWRLEALDGAVVHHHFLPSHLRSETAFTDPFFEVKNRVYFALSHGRAGRRQADVLATLNRRIGHLRASARDAARHGRLDAAGLAHYLGRADAGYHVGLQAGLRSTRRSVEIPPADDAAFHRFPTIEARGRVAVVEDRQAARRLADEGHEVQLLVTAAADEPYRVDYDDGVWVRTVPVRPRWLPESPGNREQERAAALAHALRDARADVVAGEAPALDPALRERLLAPATFPTDWELAAREALAEHDDEAFVRTLYRGLFGREADDMGLRFALHDLLESGDRRVVVRRLATSVEGRGRGIEPEFLERLPPISYAEGRGRARAAWLLDDDGFAREVGELLLGEPAPGPVADRHAFFAQLAAPPPARDRVAGVQHLPPPDVRTADELAAELDVAADAEPDAFAEAVYRTLFGRAPDEAGRWGVHEKLRDGLTRREIVAELAGSEEAVRWGIRPDVVRELLARSRAYRMAETKARARAAVRRLTRRG